jgi:GNAT superfamily N-acetyltransferase
LVVAPGCRRSGIGRWLVKQVIGDARHRGMALVRLKCPADLEANEFYARLGFRRAGIEDCARRALVLWEYALVSGASTVDIAEPVSDPTGSPVG